MKLGRDKSNAVGAYSMISILLMVNIVSIGLVLKYFHLVPAESSFVAFLIFFMIPPYIFNYFYLFKKYERIEKELVEEVETGKKKKSYASFLIYFLLTILLFFLAGVLHTGIKVWVDEVNNLFK